jgi:hypothetical protein
MEDILAASGSPKTVRRRAEDLPAGHRNDTGFVGIDWHSFPDGRHAVGTAAHPSSAL